MILDDTFFLTSVECIRIKCENVDLFLGKTICAFEMLSGGFSFVKLKRINSKTTFLLTHKHTHSHLFIRSRSAEPIKSQIIVNHIIWKTFTGVVARIRIQNRKPDIMYINAHVPTSHFNGANDRINRKNGTNRANTENKRTEKTQKVKLLSALNF